MTWTSHRAAKATRQDRRLEDRYPLEVELEYQLIRRRRVVETGSGKTVNFSSCGILFESQHALPAGMDIELSMAWPARLGGSVALTLWVSGRTVRSQDKCTAVEILRHVFRTKSGFRQADLLLRAENGSGPGTKSLL